MCNMLTKKHANFFAATKKGKKNYMDRKREGEQLITLVRIPKSAIPT